MPAAAYENAARPAGANATPPDDTTPRPMSRLCQHPPTKRATQHPRPTGISRSETCSAWGGRVDRPLARLNDRAAADLIWNQAARTDGGGSPGAADVAPATAPALPGPTIR